MSKHQRIILESNISVNANTKEEAVAIAKQRIQDRDVDVDEENTWQVEDKDVLKEIEENEKRADICEGNTDE